MKTKTNKIYVKIVLFALVFAAVVFAIAAAPAMAGPLHLDSSVMRDLLRTGDLERIHEVLDSLPSGMAPDVTDDLVPGEGPFPDGGDWGPVFPDGGGDETVDTGGDEAADDAPADEAPADGGDEAVDEPADEAPDGGGDEAVDEAPDDGGDEAVDEPADEAPDDGGDEAVDEPADDEAELPFTGGDSVPWLIGGAGVILAGAILLFCLRGRTANR